MDDETRRRELADFLRSRRSRLSPNPGEKVGARRRRTPGLRREEVARRAGLSTDLYAWLEQGRSVGVSETTARRLAAALELNPVESEHLLRLTDGNWVTPSFEDPAATRNSIAKMIDALMPHPIFAIDAVWNVIAANRSAKTLFGDFGANRLGFESNVLRYLFLDPSAKDLIVDLAEYRTRVVGQFRRQVDLSEQQAAEIVAHLRSQDPEFENLWQLHSVGVRRLGRKVLRHPAMGELVFDHGTFAVEENPRIRLVIYAAANEITQRQIAGKTLEPRRVARTRSGRR